MSIALLTRRSAIRGAAVAVLGGIAGYLTVRASGAAGGSAGGSAANAYGPPASAAGTGLLALGRLPPGSVVVLSGPRIVLARDADGAVRAFSAVCTHQGCTVGVSGGALACPCHGSRFAAGTGAVTQGPATRPLPAVRVVVRNGEVFRA